MFIRDSLLASQQLWSSSEEAETEVPPMRLRPQSYGGETLERESLVEPWLSRSLDHVVAAVQRGAHGQDDKRVAFEQGTPSPLSSVQNCGRVVDSRSANILVFHIAKLASVNSDPQRAKFYSFLRAVILKLSINAALNEGLGGARFVFVDSWFGDGGKCGVDFGDFVSNEDEGLDLEEVVEPWHKYAIKETPNVFYPIYLGEVLNERYLVEHKVGFGGGSTVWMAHDLHDKRDVALKVMSLGDWGENEYRMQNEILQNVQDTSHLVMYLGTFLIPGNEHRVLVFPLMGQCISPIELKKIPMASRMSAARQLLETFEHLHTAGIVHRDLNERNCMWGMAPLHNLNRSAKYEAVGRPLKQTIPFVDLWKKGELVRAVEVPENLRTEEFFLGDFGLAKKLSDSETQLGYPPSQFCSPERLHGKDPSLACDMWSYMVIFTVLYLRFTPFPSWVEGGIISGFVARLGPLPEKWKGLYIRPGEIDSCFLCYNVVSSTLKLDQHTTITKVVGLGTGNLHYFDSFIEGKDLQGRQITRYTTKRKEGGGGKSFHGFRTLLGLFLRTEPEYRGHGESVLTTHKKVGN
ncbi:hypothetical protein N7471_005313 [Penicillium samsonianum]|uniref:uncharacterized protein n=1 Tax=Penicillium samsonianum TaxID=1882272 RepID=UPI002546A59A|nr:uncharacterized protein N7471_005313 [Penicillium samsonianum]KAJ6138827.1 hypothetical protein N7471_005313 [Penicillium samsonianum]